MPSLIFVHPDARREAVEARAGASAMQAAMQAGVNEIVAECGGNAMCATCHVYVDPQWIERLPALGDDEDALLDGVAAERRDTSRLSCQIVLSAESDGLVLHLPDRQV